MVTGKIILFKCSPALIQIIIYFQSKANKRSRQMQIWPLLRLWGCPSRKSERFSLLFCGILWIFLRFSPDTRKLKNFHKELFSLPRTAFGSTKLFFRHGCSQLRGWLMITCDNAQFGSVEIFVGFKIYCIQYIVIYIWACRVDPIYRDIF